MAAMALEEGRSWKLEVITKATKKIKGVTMEGEGAGMNARKTKKEILNNLLVAEEMLKEIKEDILVSTKEDKDDDIYCLYNTSLIKRNKIIINKKLKEIERY